MSKDFYFLEVWNIVHRTAINKYFNYWARCLDQARIITLRFWTGIGHTLLSGSVYNPMNYDG